MATSSPFRQNNHNAMAQTPLFNISFLTNQKSSQTVTAAVNAYG